MEERIIDDPRKIKVKRNSIGGIEDATDALAPDAEDEEEELSIELPEGDLDEDLIGLAPSQLQRELEKRKKEEEQALAERNKLMTSADAALSRKEYERAESLYAQALVYDGDYGAAQEGLFTALTRGLTDDTALLAREHAERFAGANAHTKSLVRSRLGDRLNAERERAEAEAAPLREKVEKGRGERRIAFARNRTYYCVRLLIAAALVVLFLVGVGVSGAFLVHTRSVLPVVLMAVFGALALIALIPCLYLLRKTLEAQRLCAANEKLSSTEDGARLEALEEKLAVLALLLDD